MKQSGKPAKHAEADASGKGAKAAVMAGAGSGKGLWSQFKNFAKAILNPSQARTSTDAMHQQQDDADDEESGWLAHSMRQSTKPQTPANPLSVGGLIWKEYQLALG